ncbi:phage portal protein [Microbacterium saperdae]
MGLLDFLSRRTRAVDRLSASVPLISPLAGPTASIQQLVFSEYFAGEFAELTREGALSIPPLKRGRDILVATIASMQLQEWQDASETTPDWLLNGSSTGISAWHRLAMTIDDLIFYDWSLWAIKRKAGPESPIVDAIRVPYEDWSIDNTTGTVFVRGEQVNAHEVIAFPGNGSGGVLAAGATTIKGYRALERSWIGRAQNPIPLVELHQTTDDPLTDGYDDDGNEDDEAEDNEIRSLIDSWSEARTSPTGAVGFTPHNVEVRVHGNVQTDLYVEGRNAAVLDIARLLGLPASLLDGSMSTATLTYSTTEGKSNEFASYALPAWMSPIEARLSLDDVSPKGRVIRFDRSALVQAEQPAVANPRRD